MKPLLTFYLLMLPLLVAAQNISVADFKMNEHDLTAVNEATKMIDDNGEICALIKIETTQKGFYFDGGTIGIVKSDESKIGEIWVYVPAGLQRITIQHPQLGILRDYYFPDRLQSARTYIMKLITGTVEKVVKQKAASQWLVLTVEPKNAMVEVDGTIVDCSDGIYKSVLPRGTHDLRVSAKNYHTEVEKVTLDGDETMKKTITLKPAFGWIEVKGPAGATVFVDNENIGIAPLKSEPIASGQHDLRVTKRNWLPHREQVMVNDNAITTVNPRLTSNYVTLQLKTENESEIWINGEKFGEGSISVDLSPGEYTFESRKAGHRSQSIARTITLSSRGTIDIPAPVSVSGSLSIDVDPTGAKIYIDDKYVGEAPLILNDILIGHHTIKAVATGLQNEEKTVEIAEGQSHTVHIKMSKGITTTRAEGVVIEKGVLKEVPKSFRGDFVIGEDVTSIGVNAFKECKSLSSVLIPNCVKWIEFGAFWNCTSLTNVTIPGSVNGIGGNAFLGCAGLTSVTISEGVKTIGEYAFMGCHSLTSITIPASVTSIDNNAFAGCKSLSRITLEGDNINIVETAFDYSSNIDVIYVPRGSKEHYKSFLPKKVWKKIVEH